MQTWSVACYQLRGMLASFEVLGLDVDSLLRIVEIDRAELQDVDARFSELSLLRLLGAAEQRYACAPFGVHAAAAVPFGAFELMDYLIASAPTVGDIFERLASYARLCSSGLTYQIEPRPEQDGFVFTMHHPHGIETWPATAIEYLWTLIVARMRAQLGAEVFHTTLRLRHAPTGPLEVYRRHLGKVEFAQADTALHVPRAVWSRPNPRADAGLTSLLARYAHEQLDRLPSADEDLLTATRRALAEALRGGDAGAERVAKRLAITPRTLQRRLAELGYTYRVLLDEVRHELAQRYLEQTVLSLTEITYLLGYSDPSAFNRAFRRWTGDTPAEYRAQRRDAPHVPVLSASGA